MKTTRRIVQFGFLALMLGGVFLVKGNAERWCPFGGVEALYTYYHDGTMICSLAVSNLYMLAGLLAATLLMRRIFCGYACPIGTLSEWLNRLSRRLGLPALRVPYRLDRGLALAKYAVLGIILYFTWRVGELYFRTADPCYALISRHGEDITAWAYIVSGAIVVASLLLTMPFCRWLCPLGAVFNPFSRIGLTRVKRDTETCINCGQCAKHCPMAIPVDQVPQVTHARCLTCLNCVDACPAADKGALVWGPPRSLGRAWPQGAIIAFLLLVITGVVGMSYAFPLPSFIAARGEPPARTEMVRLKVANLTCRGKATLLKYFLERDDDSALDGYLKIEAWPGPGFVDAHITYDPARTDPTTIKQAITEPYLEGTAVRPSPFEIQGYDPLNAAQP